MLRVPRAGALPIALLAVRFVSAAAPAPTFRAGAHAVEITPRTFPIPISGGFTAVWATRADGALYARALALDDGGQRFVIAVVDTLMMPRELLDRVKQASSRLTGVPPERMLISATHTHSAPPLMGALGTDADPEYTRFVEPRLVEAIAGAVSRLAPARVGWTVVQDPEHTHCRRWILRPDRMGKDPFGGLTVRANMHPGYRNPDFVGPAGPVDPALSMVAFQSADGRPLALLANYSMHYVGAPRAVVSPDYYGPFVENIQRLTGVAVAMMSQGASGDQHWMDYSQARKDMDARRYADELAGIVAAAYRDIEYRERVRCVMAETKLRLGRRVPDAGRLDWAREIVARMAGEPERELKLQALRIGDFGIAAIPNEVFAITGLKIKAQSPLRPAIVMELANGAEGYIPPPEQHALGGYTTWPARTAALVPEAEPRIVDAVLGLLEAVSGKRRLAPAEDYGDYAKAILADRPMAYWRGSEFCGPAAKDASGHNRGVAFYLEGPASAAFSGARRPLHPRNVVLEPAAGGRPGHHGNPLLGRARPAWDRRG